MYTYNTSYVHVSNRETTNDKKKNIDDEDSFEDEEEENGSPKDEKPPKTEAELFQWLQSLFLFSMCWSIGGHLDSDARERFSDFMKVLAAGTNKQHPR